MKRITVDIEEAEFDAMDIQSSHLSLNELEKKILAHRIRKNVSKMHEIAFQSEERFLSEEEIFAMANDIKSNL